MIRMKYGIDAWAVGADSTTIMASPSERFCIKVSAEMSGACTKPQTATGGMMTEGRSSSQFMLDPGWLLTIGRWAEGVDRR